MKPSLFIIAWLTISIFSGAAMNANMRANGQDRFRRYGTIECEVNATPRNARSDAVVSFIPNLLPPVWIATLLITGLYQDGFSFRDDIIDECKNAYNTSGR